MNEQPENTNISNASSEVKTLGVSAVSKVLGVSRATVLRWVQAQKIEGFFRIGRKWLIRKEDFDQFIDRKIKNEYGEQ